MGFIVESPALAKIIAERFDSTIPAHAYQVRLDRRGGLEWAEQGEGAEKTYDREPGTSFWRRLGVSLLSLLPIDWLL